MNEKIDAIPWKEPGAPNGTFLLLFFYQGTVKNEAASRDGPPVFDVVDYVRVVVPGTLGDGGPIYEIVRRKEDGTIKKDAQIYKRFGKPYEDWKEGRAVADSGTPLEKWPLMDVGIIAAFKAANVYTVQQLAELPDSALDSAIRRGGREWRAKAVAWLDEARTAAGDVEARATIARQQEQIDQLTAQVADLLKRGNKEALGYDAPKRGRQRREDAPETVNVVEEPDARL